MHIFLHIYYIYILGAVSSSDPPSKRAPGYEANIHDRTIVECILVVMHWYSVTWPHSYIICIPRSESSEMKRDQLSWSLPRSIQVSSCSGQWSYCPRSSWVQRMRWGACTEDDRHSGGGIFRSSPAEPLQIWKEPGSESSLCNCYYHYYCGVIYTQSWMV